MNQFWDPRSDLAIMTNILECYSEADKKKREREREGERPTGLIWLCLFLKSF